MKNGNNWVIASNERQILGWQMHAIGHYGLFWLSHLEEAEFLDTSQALKLLLLSLCVFYLLTPHDLLEGLELSFEDCRSTGTTEESLWWLNPQYPKCLFLSVNYINLKYLHTHTHTNISGRSSSIRSLLTSHYNMSYNSNQQKHFNFSFTSLMSLHWCRLFSFVQGSKFCKILANILFRKLRLGI